MAVCGGTRRDGTPCTANTIPGERWCYHHHPDYAERRKQSAARAATLKHSSVAKELREIREFMWELLELTIADRLPHRARRELQNVVQLLQCYLRAAELEMRAAEEPLKADLDVKGLKSQVIQRIEVLEAQERERQELLSELVPMMESRGYDTQAVMAVM